MDRSEAVALILVLLVMIGVPLAAYNYETLRMVSDSPASIEVQAWTTENGGWDPSRVVVREGEVLRLTLRSMDITHSFVIPDLGVDSGPLKPGETVVLELQVERPGVYVFYCGIWCSPKHEEMRGRLIVVEAGA